LVSCSLVGQYDSFQGKCIFRGTAGDAHGEIVGRRFTMRVFWGSKSTCNYTGTIIDDGSIVGGRTFDMKNTRSQATWWLTWGRLTCRLSQ
jgi:hypothetical protein